MIECSNEYLLKKSRKKRKRKSVIIISIVFALTLLFFYQKYFISKNVFLYCENYIKSSASENINDAVLFSLDNLSYDSVISVEKNVNGDVVLISANNLKVNALSRKVVDLTKVTLDDKLKSGVPVPLLSFTGIGFISGYGRKVNFKSLNVGMVNCEFLSDFKSVGINQTLHSIYVNINCKIAVNIPFNNEEICISSKILVCENVIVGKVPDLYLGKNLF